MKALWGFFKNYKKECVLGPLFKLLEASFELFIPLLVKQIIDIELKVLYQRIEQIGYHINLSDEAKTFVATKGYDVQFGARPLKRAIQNYIEDGISDLIVNGNLEPGATIHIGKAENKEELTFS